MYINLQMDKKDKNTKSVSFKEQPEIIKPEVHHRIIENAEPVIKKDSVEILKEEQTKTQEQVQPQTNEAEIAQLKNNEMEIVDGENEATYQKNQFIEIVKSFSIIPSLQTVFFIILLIVCFFVFIYNRKTEYNNSIKQTQQMQEI